MKKLSFLIMSAIIAILLLGCDISTSQSSGKKTLQTADPNAKTTITVLSTSVEDTSTIGNTTISQTVKPTTTLIETTTKDRSTTTILSTTVIAPTTSFTQYITTTTSKIDEYDSVYFIEINDTHGQLVTTDNIGMAEVAGLIDYLEAKADQPYIKIANGDIFQGSYVSRMTYGECFIDTLNAMNFDMMTLGNHEFDWTLDQIAVYWDGDESNGEANFPLVCCNLIDTKNYQRPSWVQPYAIIEYGSLKVGIIGAIGADEESDISTTTIGTYQFDVIESYAKKYAKELRDQGCDVVCLAVHDYDSNTYSSYGNFPIESRIDAMFFGHTHQSVDGVYSRSDGYSIPYVQSYTKNGNIGEIVLSLNDNNIPESYSINHYNKSYYNTYVKKANSEVAGIIQDKYQKIVDEGNTVIYKSATTLNSKQKVANFACDMMNEMYSCDVSYLNMGGVRAYLSSSNVMVSDIFEIFPFDNKIVICEMTGANLKKYLEKNTGLYFNSSFDKTQIDENKTYKICTIDYVALSGNSYMKNYCVGSKFTTTSDIMRDSLVNYLKNKK